LFYLYVCFFIGEQINDDDGGDGGGRGGGGGDDDDDDDDDRKCPALQLIRCLMSFTARTRQQRNRNPQLSETCPAW